MTSLRFGGWGHSSSKAQDLTGMWVSFGFLLWLPDPHLGRTPGIISVKNLALPSLPTAGQTLLLHARHCPRYNKGGSAARVTCLLEVYLVPNGL